MTRARGVAVSTALAIASSLGVARGAHADPTSGVDASALFRASYDANGLFSLEGARLMPRRDLSFKAIVGYAHSPFTLVVPGIGDGNASRLLDMVTTIELAFGMTLTERFAIGFNVGAYRTATGDGYGVRGTYNDGQITRQSTGAIALRPLSNLDPSAVPGNGAAYLGDELAGPLDARVGAKYALYASPRLAITAVGSVWLPFGDEEMFLGDRSLVFEPKLAVEARPRRGSSARILMNVAARIRERTVLEGYDTEIPSYTSANALAYFDLGSEVVAGLGGAIDVTPRITAVAEAQAFLSLPAAFDWGSCTLYSGAPCADATYVPGVGRGDNTAVGAIGAMIRLSADVTASVVIGAGYGGARADDVRLTTGLVWAPQPAGAGTPGHGDRDGDGIPDSLDACPDEPEDKDGFQDDDGCPDPDNDGDGIPDSRDKCPNEAEDKDGFQDEDGCPDPDNDGDGIPDSRTSVRTSPRTRTASRTRTAVPIRTTITTASPMRPTNARTTPRRSTASRTKTAARIRARPPVPKSAPIASISKASRSASARHRDVDRRGQAVARADRAADQGAQAVDPRRGARRARHRVDRGRRGARAEGPRQGAREQARAGDPRCVDRGRRAAGAGASGRPRLRAPARHERAGGSGERARRPHQVAARRDPVRRLAFIATLLAPALAHAAPVSDVEVPAIILDQDTTAGPQADEALDLANIVQSAAKGVTTVQEAPAIVTVVTAEEIKDRQFQDLEQLVDTIPGWQRVSIFDSTFDTPIVRGQVQAVQFLQDGLSLFDPFVNVPAISRVVPMETVKRVELITGPGGVLWGSNSLLGIFNVITKDAEDVDGLEVGGTLGDGNGDRRMGRVYAMYGDPDALGGKLKVFAHGSVETYQGGAYEMPLLLFHGALPQPNAANIYGPLTTTEEDQSIIANLDGKITYDKLQLRVSLPFGRMYNPMGLSGDPVTNAPSAACEAPPDPSCTDPDGTSGRTAATTSIASRCSTIARACSMAAPASRCARTRSSSCARSIRCKSSRRRSRCPAASRSRRT